MALSNLSTLGADQVFTSARHPHQLPAPHHAQDGRSHRARAASIQGGLQGRLLRGEARRRRRQAPRPRHRQLADPFRDSGVQSPAAKRASPASSSREGPARTTRPFCSTIARSLCASTRAVVAVDDQRGDARSRGCRRSRARSRPRSAAPGPSVASSRIISVGIASSARGRSTASAARRPTAARRGASGARPGAERSPARARSVQSRRPSRPGRARHHQVLAHRQVGEDAAAFGHVGRRRAAPPRAAARATTSCPPTHDAALALRHVAEQRADQRGLAHAVAAEQADASRRARCAGRRRAARGSSRTRRARPLASSEESPVARHASRAPRPGRRLHLGVGAHGLPARRRRSPRR